MLAEHLLELPRRTLGTVVHVGAGSGIELEAYQALQPQRLLLVEGDGEAAAELRAGARRVPGAEVRECVVMPQAGEVLWRRYNLPALNGPRRVSGLEPYFPRLRLLGEQAQAALALADLLRPLADALPKGRPSALVLDVPGQEDALLAALPRELLQAFEWIVLRGCATAGDGAAPGQAVQRLAGQGYAGQASRHEADPLWPVALLRFDRARFETMELAEQRRSVEALSKRLAESEAARERLKQELEDRDARQHLLDAEILRAEAQLGFIRDVLIREKNF